jgi:hypothetical protein
MIDTALAQKNLKSIFKNSNDKFVKGAAETANLYTDMFSIGKIEPDEYTGLMSFVLTTNEKNRNVKNINDMENLNRTIAELIVKANTK